MRRTLNLGAAHISLEITKHRRAEKGLRESERVLALSLQELRERERIAIAREVHDELGQALTGLRIDLVWLMEKLPKSRRELQDRGRAMVDLVDSTVNNVRRIASSLRPAILDDLGAAAAIEWMASEFGERTGMQCLVDVEDLELAGGVEANTAAFRIFQEALTNVARHADATKVEVSLRRKGGECVLEIADDGVGISDAALSDRRSLGLLGMRERAAALGWSLDIAKNPSAGTKVVLRIPHPPQQTPGNKKVLKERNALS